MALNKEEAYADPSPLAIINEDYKEGQLNPFPGPVNFGPDSPMSWAPEEEMPDLPGMVTSCEGHREGSVRCVWVCGWGARSALPVSCLAW